MLFLILWWRSRTQRTITPNTEDVVKDINMEHVDDIKMEEDSNIQGKTVTVATLRRERDKLSNLVIKINKKNLRKLLKSL